MDFSQFENSIHVSFKDKALLRQAFTHRSYLNENKKPGLEHNERLEFLGDAVLELVSTVFLYKKYPDQSEGTLTAYRSSLVNATTLSEVASKIGMESFLLLSHGESKDKGKARQYILANTFEALVGALYIDQGYEAAQTFIESFVMNMIDDIVAQGSFVDSKSLFQEKAQENESVTPQYKVVKEAGPDHDKVFTIGVYLREDKIAEGEGHSKQEAEQKAAERALEVKGW